MPAPAPTERILPAVPTPAAGDSDHHAGINPWVIGAVGTANFFDGFDNLAIAFALPLLVPAWHLTPVETGILISGGYLGQAVGAVGGGMLSERIGRTRMLAASVAVLSVFSLAGALSGSYAALLASRFIQGMGLGAEVPIAATYINETTPARHRGRVIFMLQTVFTLGIVCVSLAALWIVPRFGWRSLFVVGALPVILVPVLFRLPETAPWRALKEGRTTVSRSGNGPATTSSVDASSPNARIGGLHSLFAGGLARDTVAIWTVNFSSSSILYGLSTWMPTLYTRVFGLPLAVALRYNFATTGATLVAAVLGIVLVDRIARHRLYMLGFGISALLIFVLAAMGASITALDLAVIGPVAIMFLSLLISCGYFHMPEVYPTRIRAMGVGVGSAWYRVGSIAGPFAIGAILSGAGLGVVFAACGTTAILGMIIAMKLMRPEQSDAREACP